jgi:ATP-dependent Lon protease
LPKLQELTRQLDDPHAMERSADTDVNQRRRRLLEKLLALGPDRRVAVPGNGQQALDELKATLPHFREPIRSIRNALALAQATKTPPRIAPQLLLGPPGLGKTFFSHRVAELFGATHGCVQFDQPSGGVHLRSDAHRHGRAQALRVRFASRQGARAQGKALVSLPNSMVWSSGRIRNRGI